MNTGRQCLNQGYAFPDVDKLVRNHKIDLEQADMIREAKTEALKETMKIRSVGIWL